MNFRRVVTGYKDGVAVIVSDEELMTTSLKNDAGERVSVWARDDTAVFPDDGTRPQTSAHFPPPGGCRVTLTRIKAGREEEFDGYILDRLGEWADQDRPGFHRTPTLDFDVVLEGEVVLQVDAQETVLRTGDIAVQNGTWHRWVNRGTTDVVLAVVIVGAESAE